MRNVMPLSRRQVLICGSSAAVAALLFHSHRPRLTAKRTAVLGVGGAGGNLVRRLRPKKSSQIYVAHTDKPWALRGCEEAASIAAGELIFSQDPMRVYQRAENAEIVAKGIYDSLPDVDQLVIVAGLGGITGTYIAPAVAQIASRCGIQLQALVVLPFSWEGDLRHGPRARHGLDMLRETVEHLQIVDMDAQSSFVPQDMTMSQFFEFADERAAKTITAMIERHIIPSLGKASG